MRPVGPTALLRQGRNTVLLRQGRKAVLGWRREHRVSTIVENVGVMVIFWVFGAF
jgi:hypothetical protein